MKCSKVNIAKAAEKIWNLRLELSRDFQLLQTFLWTLISFQTGFILIYLTPVPGKLNYVEIMCPPAFPASEGNIARGAALGNGHTLSSPVPSLRSWWGWFLEGMYCEVVKKMREQGVKNPPAAWEGSLPSSNCFLNMCQWVFCSPTSSHSLPFASPHPYPPSRRVYTSR